MVYPHTDKLTWHSLHVEKISETEKVLLKLETKEDLDKFGRYPLGLASKGQDPEQ